MRKSAITAEAAAALVSDGARVMIGGFLGVGSPDRLIDALVARGARALTIIGNDTAYPTVGVGRLIEAGCVARVEVSHIGTNPTTQRLMSAGAIEVELIPQGTLAERIRAGGSRAWRRLDADRRGNGRRARQAGGRDRRRELSHRKAAAGGFRPAARA